MCSLIILLHVGLHVHILKITYYISWLTCTLQRQYLQLKHNTDTDIYSRTIELYAPLNNLISLRQQWVGYNIYKETVMTVTRIITYYVITSKMGAYNVFNNHEFILQRVLHRTLGNHFFFTVLRLNIYMWPTKKRDINPLTTTQFLKPLYKYNTITVMPVSQSNFTDLPFNNIDNNEIDFADNTNNNVHHNKTNDDPLINEDSYDHSELGNYADPDCNFLVNNRQTICAYYNEHSFNESYQHPNTFSLL